MTFWPRPFANPRVAFGSLAFAQRTPASAFALTRSMAWESYVGAITSKWSPGSDQDSHDEATCI